MLVEASDLSRAAGYGPRATPAQARALRRDALQRSDALLGELLARTDPEHDAVLVLSPVAPRASPELAITALRAPGVHGGVLRSPTTRRDGYVQLADVAPTVLALLGEEQPDEIEGRAFEVSARSGVDRVGQLADEAAAAGFRDSLMPLVVPLDHRRTRRPRLGHLAGGAAPRPLAIVSRARCLPGARRRPGHLPGQPAGGREPEVRRPTSGAVVAVAAVVAAGVVVVDRRSPGIGPLVAIGAIVALFAVDVLVGAPLQVNAVFGYSVAVAGRFAGLGNLAFALFGAAAIVLGALVVDRYGSRGVPAATVLLVGVVLIEGLPMLGADVGGVLSMVPAFGVTALVLAGRRPGLRAAVGLVAAAGLTVLVFAFVDAARPAGAQTHLARLAEHLVDGRWGSFFDSLTRRLQASFGGAEVAAWALVVVLIVVVAIYVVLAARGTLARWRDSWDGCSTPPPAPRRPGSPCSPWSASSPTTRRSRCQRRCSSWSRPSSSSTPASYQRWPACEGAKRANHVADALPGTERP